MHILRIKDIKSTSIVESVTRYPKQGTHFWCRKINQLYDEVKKK